MLRGGGSVQSYLVSNTLNIDIDDFQKRNQLISKLIKRFSSYSYEQIQTSTFASYDLYTYVNGTINQDEMIKVIDPGGKVLVLRPDVTIPITKKLAEISGPITEEQRYFYVENVFRHSLQQTNEIERTQAGIEYFGNNRPEADAEVIAIAATILNDLHLGNYKIEVGHAGFFKELLTQLKLTTDEETELKHFIQTKNTAELNHFLSKLTISKRLANAIRELPHLYGNPLAVLQRAKVLLPDNRFVHILQSIEEVYELLKTYGVANNIIIDLSLVNHMDYYSAIIFQGFIEKIGKPVLMGGRYDQLANQFKASFPAIGFACDIDLLVLNSSEQVIHPSTAEIAIYYSEDQKHTAITTANRLRNWGYRVVIYYLTKEQSPSAAVATIYLKSAEKSITINNAITTFTDVDEIKKLLESMRRKE